MDDAREWIKFGVWALTVLIGVLVTVWRFLTKPMLDQLNGFGARLKHVEAEHEKLEGRVEHVDRDHERFEFQQRADGERMGKLESLADRIDVALDGVRNAIATNDKITSSKLASIDAKMDVGVAIKEAIGEVTKTVDRAVQSLKR